MDHLAWQWICAALRGEQPLCQTLGARCTAADWTQIAALVEFHECAPLVWECVRDSTLPGARDWRGAYYATALLNERRLAALLPWLAEMQRWDVTPVLLKGAALLATTYTSLGQRQMSDIDVLVAWPEIPSAWAVLSAERFVLQPHTMPAWQWRTSGELRLVQQASGAFIELHWLLYAGMWGRQARLHAIWPGTLQAQLLDGTVTVLDPAEQVLHLAFHLAVSNQFSNGLGRMLADLDRAARDPGLNWAVVWALAHRRGLHAVLWSALRLVARWLHTPIPAEWQRLVSCGRQRLLERLLIPADLAQAGGRSGRWRRAVQLALAPDLRALSGLAQSGLGWGR